MNFERVCIVRSILSAFRQYGVAGAFRKRVAAAHPDVSCRLR